MAITITTILAVELAAAVPLLFWLENELSKKKADAKRCDCRETIHCWNCPTRAGVPDHDAQNECRSPVADRQRNSLKPVEGGVVGRAERENATRASQQECGVDFHLPISSGADRESIPIDRLERMVIFLMIAAGIGLLVAACLKWAAA